MKRETKQEELRRLRRKNRALREALIQLYTFPGVRELLAPRESLMSIAALVEDALGRRPTPKGTETKGGGT